MAHAARLDSSRMGTEPEGRLLLQMSVPMMISMLVQALYNVVDSAFVSLVHEDCLAALSLAFPAQNIMIGLGTGTGVGLSALISRALGSRDREQAAKLAGIGLFLSGCCWALIALFGILAGDAFVRAQTSVESIRAYADDYLSIVTVCSLFMYLEITVERLLQSTGLTKLSMWTQIAGAVTNIILDPFFILNGGDPFFFGLRMPFGLGLGTAGAAIATVIGQAAGAGLGLWFHLRRNGELPFRLGYIRPALAPIGEIYRIGFPSILMMGIGSVTNFLMNLILGVFTSTAVAVYGAYFKVQSFFFMPVFGLNNGLIPIVGFNFGAGKKRRIYNTVRWGVVYATALTLAGFLTFQLVPGALLSIFNPSPEMLVIGTHALRRISPSFLLAGFCIVAGSVCQALGKSMYSFLVSIFRQVLGLIPAAWLLSLTGDVNNVWWCFPIAELLSLVASVFFLRASFRYMDRVFDARSAAEPAPAEEPDGEKGEAHE